MIELNRLGLGTMGMSIVRNPENSVKTIHAALDAGITFFNTGEFYNGSESELIAAAKELGVKVLAFGTVGHGLLRDDILTAPINPRMTRGLLAPEHRENNLAMIRKVKEIADEKGVSLSQLALSWSLAKYDHVQSLIGTTNPDHLQAAIDALKVTLTNKDISRIEAAFPADKISGRSMRNFVFTNGRMSMAH